MYQHSIAFNHRLKLPAHTDSEVPDSGQYRTYTMNRIRLAANFKCPSCIMIQGLDTVRSFLGHQSEALPDFGFICLEIALFKVKLPISNSDGSSLMLTTIQPLRPHPSYTSQSSRVE